MINYINTSYSKVMHKYLLKFLYNKTNKKEYKLQIWQNNISYINMIEMKDIIILENTREKKKLLKDLINTTTLAKIA